MAELKLPRFMLAAPASGSGKTTLTCAVLKALMNKGLKTAAFKSGPDYIDPMFHSRVIGKNHAIWIYSCFRKKLPNIC